MDKEHQKRGKKEYTANPTLIYIVGQLVVIDVVGQLVVIDVNK
jgi:hypothetical protein